MNKSGIRPGALVLVDEQQAPAHGDKIVALINGQPKIGHLYQDESTTALIPNSTARYHKPVILPGQDSILGVIIAVLPKSRYPRSLR